MESEKSMENPSVPVLPVKRPNYMLMSLQRIFVLSVILVGVLIVVHYTPMPGTITFCDSNWPAALCLVH